MSRILFAWEVGDHSGHVVPFLPLLRRYREAGHEVVVAARDTGEVGERVHEAGLALVQAPVCLKAFDVPGDSVHYPEILQHFGYAHAPTLTGLALAWRSLFDLVRPDVVLANNSPLAIWTARSRNLPRARLGSGFNCPPLGDPMPALRAGDTGARRRASEARVAATLWTVAAKAGLAPAKGVAELFEGCATWLFTYRELDHYGAREDAEYLGMPGDPRPAVPAADAPEIFAYLRRRHPHTERTLATLAKLDRPTLVCCPDLEPRDEERFGTRNVRLARSPADIRALLPHARLVVSHAGHNLAAESLLEGVPLLALPGHLEQDLVARNVERAGCGIRVAPDERHPRLAAAVERLLGDPSFHESAAGLAHRWRADPKPAPSLERMSP